MSPVSDLHRFQLSRDFFDGHDFKAKIPTRGEYIFLAKLAEEAERFEGKLYFTPIKGFVQLLHAYCELLQTSFFK
jgi:hypothetical protein